MLITDPALVPLVHADFPLFDPLADHFKSQLPLQHKLLLLKRGNGKYAFICFLHLHNLLKSQGLLHLARSQIFSRFGQRLYLNRCSGAAATQHVLAVLREFGRQTWVPAKVHRH